MQVLKATYFSTFNLNFTSQISTKWALHDYFSSMGTQTGPDLISSYLLQVGLHDLITDLSRWFAEYYFRRIPWSTYSSVCKEECQSELMRACKKSVLNSDLQLAAVGSVKNSCLPLEFVFSLLWSRNLQVSDSSNPEVQCCIYKGSPIIPILSWIKPIPRVNTYFFKAHSNIVLPHTPMLSQRSDTVHW